MKAAREQDNSEFENMRTFMQEENVKLRQEMRKMVPTSIKPGWQLPSTFAAEEMEAKAEEALLDDLNEEEDGFRLGRTATSRHRLVLDGTVIDGMVNE